MSTTATPHDQLGTLLEFLFRLGQAYLASGEQTAQVELILRRLATAYGVKRSRIVAFPTALFITIQDGEHERTTVAEGPTHALRLDQIAAVYHLGDQARQGHVDPQSGLRALSQILKQPPRFGVAAVVFGHVTLSVGLAMLLTAAWPNLVAAALLGLLVGLLKALNRNQPVLSVPLPVIAAMLVSVLVFAAVQWHLPIDPLHVLVPPLVTFLPGAMLTFGMVELAYGDMVSGSSRLLTGGVQLLLLVVGLAAGATVVGYSGENLVDVATGLRVAEPWRIASSWIGVLAFGIGVYLHFSAPPASLRWILLVLLVTFAVQQLVEGHLGQVAGGFLGMLVVTPLCYLIQLRFHGPPAMVTFLPSFWILVPGALSLLSVKYMLSDRAAALDGFVTAVFAIVSIALGTLMGAAIYKQLTERLGAWSLLLGRAGRRTRRPRRK